MPTRTRISTRMTEAAQLLQAWLSPGYPVGAFAYSHGLEWAVASGAVRDAATARDWLADVLAHGAGRTDAILLAAAHGGEDVAPLARALAGSRERLLETEAMGAAFAAVTAAAHGLAVAAAPYPVALGRAAALAGVPLAEVVALYLQAFAANLVGAAVRLVPLGQTKGAAIVAGLMPLCRAVAAEAASAGLDGIGGAAILSDIAAMRHETQDVRLFRT